MENSLDSSNSETSVSGLKSVFKKPTNFNPAFEVSLNESTTGSQINRSDLDQDTTSRSKIFKPFEQQRKSIQGFSVNAHESAVNSESEQSGVFFNPKSVFAKKQTVDSFNVTFNESKSNSNVGTSLSEESLLLKKTNPFRQSNKENDISIRVEESEQVDLGNHFSFAGSDVENVDSTTFVTKPNPFKKNSENASDKLEVSRSDSVWSEKDGNIVDADSTSWMTKENPFGKRKSSQNTSNLSLTEQRSCESTQGSKLAFSDREAASLNISLLKVHPELYMNESSINDENLNNWMSDQSEDEVLLPVVPLVENNMSLTKESQNTPRMEKSPPRTNWEEKFNDIISKALKKRDVHDPTPVKPKPKKAAAPIENQEKKYKPKKLIKPASYATKGLYQFILKKFKLKYGVDAILEAEDMVFCICDTVKKVLRRKTYQKSLIQSLKKKMARAELIETTMDFYEFVIKYLPYDFRVKVVPCLQPLSNTVYPPKDVMHPFDKIL